MFGRGQGEECHQVEGRRDRGRARIVLCRALDRSSDDWPENVCSAKTGGYSLVHDASIGPLQLRRRIPSSIPLDLAHRAGIGSSATSREGELGLAEAITMTNLAFVPVLSHRASVRQVARWPSFAPSIAVRASSGPSTAPFRKGATRDHGRERRRAWSPFVAFGWVAEFVVAQALARSAHPSFESRPRSQLKSPGLNEFRTRSYSRATQQKDRLARRLGEPLGSCLTARARPHRTGWRSMLTGRPEVNRTEFSGDSVTRLLPRDRA